LSLAFYICYLIIFDVHAVNASYTEDVFFGTKRSETYTNIHPRNIFKL
jgi:hypothetical protein